MKPRPHKPAARTPQRPAAPHRPHAAPATKPQPAERRAAICHDAELAPGAQIQLSATALAGVQAREIRVSEAFTLVDARGHHLRASLQREDGACVVYERLAAPTESPLRLVLACAVLSRQRMLFVAQKAAELGCDELVPLLTTHSVPAGAPLEKEKPWAWPGQALKGSRQCRRARVMAVADPVPLRDYVHSASFRGADARYVLDDVGGAANALPEAEPSARTVVLLVGPEGGFHDDERALLAQCKVHSLRLGARVLRAETAALVGVTLLQHRLGDLR